MNIPFERSRNALMAFNLDRNEDGLNRIVLVFTELEIDLNNSNVIVPRPLRTSSSMPKNHKFRF